MIKNLHIKPLNNIIAASIAWASYPFDIDFTTASDGAGASDTLYSFSGTGYRWATTSDSDATNTHFIAEWWHHTPDYETTETRFSAAAFWSPTSGGETLIADGESITIQGVWIETSSGVWAACEGASEGGVATLTDSASTALLPPVVATLAANTSYRARWAFTVSDVDVLIPRNQLQPDDSAPGGQGRVQGATTSLFATATTASALTNSGGIYFTPPFAVAKGGDGRDSRLVVGDSIGYGVSDSQADSIWSDRNAVGFIERALDSGVRSMRMPYHIMCIPGQRPVRTSEGDATAWTTQANWQGKIDALTQVYNANGGRWPFTDVWNQHITNSVPSSLNLRTEMTTYFNLLTTLFGKPITALAGLPATTSTDGFATTANQTPVSGYDASSSNTGHLWVYNNDLTGHFEPQGIIADSINTWGDVSAGTTEALRDLWAVGSFSTTLASSYTSGNDIVTVDAPPVGIALASPDGNFGPGRTVAEVTGSGPYTVTLAGALDGPISSGAVVRDAWGDDVHPSPARHIEIAETLIDHLVSLGLTPPNAVPAITSSSITGTAEDGQVLTASYEATGFPVPTAAYQWQKNGADISGQTSSSITLDESGMSLSDADTISCEITITNSEGSDNAEPTIAFVGSSGAVPTFLATISGSSESGFFDFTEATTNGASRVTNADDNGGEAFTSPAVSTNPTISGTLGLVYPDATTAMDRSQASGNYTIVLTLTKDDGVGDSSDAYLLNNDIRIRSGSSTSLSQTTEVDGSSVATRGELYTALDDEAEHTVVVSGLNTTLARLGRNGSGFQGSIRRCAIISETDAGANLATWTTEAIAAVEAS